MFASQVVGLESVPGIRCAALKIYGTASSFVLPRLDLCAQEFSRRVVMFFGKKASGSWKKDVKGCHVR